MARLGGLCCRFEHGGDPSAYGPLQLQRSLAGAPNWKSRHFLLAGVKSRSRRPIRSRTEPGSSYGRTLCGKPTPTACFRASGLLFFDARRGGVRAALRLDRESKRFRLVRRTYFSLRNPARREPKRKLDFGRTGAQQPFERFALLSCRFGLSACAHAVCLGRRFGFRG